MDGVDIVVYADSLREPFINCWSELCGWDATEIFTLRYLSFFPVVLEICDTTLLGRSDNTITFTTKPELLFPKIGDYIFSYVLVSNDEAVQDLPYIYIWR